MKPLRTAISRAGQRLRNAAGGAVLRAGAKPGGDIGAAPGLQHFPSSPPETHRPGYDFPAWMDDREPWVASLRELYALPISWPTSLSPQAGLYLHTLVLNVAPTTVIETGTYMGVSTHWLAAALKSLGPDAAGRARRIHCFDMFDMLAWRDRAFLESQGERTQLEFVQRRLERAGLADLVHLHPGDSSAGIRAMHGELAGAESGVQLAFIDGDHTEAGVVRDFRAVEPLLAAGGYVVLHDIYPGQCNHPGPRFLLDNLPTITAIPYERCELYTSPLNYGMAVLRKMG